MKKIILSLIGLLIILIIIGMFSTRQIKTEININASTEKVWSIITDNEKYSEWNPFIIRLSGNLKPGNSVDVTIKPEGEEAAKASEEQAQSAEQVARAGHRLNILAAMFFPLTALASVFGMNIPHGLEASPHWVSYAMMGAGLFLGLIMLGYVIGGRNSRARIDSRSPRS